MNSSASTLTILYTGDLARVDPEKITEDMYVPNVGQRGVRHADDRPGEVAARLFDTAESEGALLVPKGLRIECLGDDDTDGGGIILIAYRQSGTHVGVTCGWRDAENLAAHPVYEREDNDPAVVRAALEFMVDEINHALRPH
jgi:hypothetical protein